MKWTFGLLLLAGPSLCASSQHPEQQLPSPPLDWCRDGGSEMLTDLPQLTQLGRGTVDLCGQKSPKCCPGLAGFASSSGVQGIQGPLPCGMCVTLCAALWGSGSGGCSFVWGVFIKEQVGTVPVLRQLFVRRTVSKWSSAAVFNSSNRNQKGTGARRPA